MATIVYLDTEDEITSAATRIRQAADRRVALVLPFGSRVATSRINFKLLAREAMSNGRRLDIVAPDASARALAASAGLPVFASVAEYEDALDAPPPDDSAPTAVTGASRPTPADTGAATAAVETAARRRPAPEPTRADEGMQPDVEKRGAASRQAELDAIIHRGREVPVAKPRRRGPRPALIAGLVVLLLAFAAAGAAAVAFLPSATITIAPRIQAVGPIDLVVTADPAATAVDETERVIPAQAIEIPVEVSGEFQATGKRVERTPAKGGVRWRNCDNSAAYTIPSGTVVRTSGGIEFKIDEQVFLPVAVISGGGANPQLRCQTSEVAVTAVKPGPDGNVPAGAIDVVPARYNRNLITVNNPAPTEGGAQEEFTRIHRRDVDAAVASLTADLATRFRVQLEDPSGVPGGATVFPDTAVLGEGVPSVDPETLVNQEVESFQLTMTATGTVLAVDSSPVEAIAATALADAVTPGYQLVDGSTRVAVGEGTVDGDHVVFRVAGAARQVRPVDGEALHGQVLGLGEAAARALLEPFGVVEITFWPDMVSTVPTLGQRVTLTVLPPVDEGPQVEPVPATPEPTEPGEASPGGDDPSGPVPSG